MVEGAGHNAGMEDYILLVDTDHIDVSQASDELDEVQARQLSFDHESAYNDFTKILYSYLLFSLY